MRRFLSFFAIFILGTFHAQFLSGQNDAENFDVVFDRVNAEKDGWIFLTASRKGEIYENLYGVNVKDSQTFLIMENPAETPFIFSNLCWLPEKQTLYFGIHNGHGLVNGVQLFYGEGTYVLKKDDEGNFSSKGLRRYSKLEPWLCQLAKKAYFDNLSSPDFTGFLNFLFSFCDFDVNPVFVCKSPDGKILLNEAALTFLYKNADFDGLCRKEKENYRSPFEDYLFCLDSDNNVTSVPAITGNHSEVFYREGSAQVQAHFFKAFKGRVFMLENLGSYKELFYGQEKKSGSQWTVDFSKIYLLFDSDGDFLINQPAGYGEIRLEAFETPFPKRRDTAPLFDFNKNLYLRDVNHRDFYQLKKDFSFKKASSPFGRKSPDGLYLLIAAFPAFFAAAFILLLQKIRREKSSFDVEEKIRSDISSDIHDSVVQDIRAVRIDVERLKVEENSEALKQSAVNNLTACIKKMRDICYSLNPAEIANAELTSSKVDVISVVQTLCEHFSERTKIPFFFDSDEKLLPAFLKKEDAACVSRIILEILSNIEKHSFATKFTLLIRQKNEENHDEKTLLFMIIDDGAGCDLASLSKKKMKTHFGMRNMRLFAKKCGGKIEFLSACDEGMQVRLSLKIKE